jgi:hypothetical protein
LAKFWHQSPVNFRRHKQKQKQPEFVLLFKQLRTESSLIKGADEFVNEPLTTNEY